MKKVCIQFALCFLFIFTVASFAQAEVGVVGTWTYKYNWNCGSSYGTSTIVFYSDGTFKTGSYTGTWHMVGHEITWIFDSGTTYSGRKIGSSIQGMMVRYDGNLEGCFYLIHSSTATKLTIAPLSPELKIDLKAMEIGSPQFDVDGEK